MSKLNEITKQRNLTEIRQVETERTVNSMKFAEYMSYRIGQKFDGIVSTVTPYGLFIELGNLIEGFVQIRNIGPDFYIYNDANFTIANKNNTDVYSIGRSVKVEVIYANKEDHRIDFKII
ncbi:S1 RNA-binding domain-containing protein [bacterium]|nr:S1 RNA-binding domain-containing protein [bacterium]